MLVYQNRPKKIKRVCDKSVTPGEVISADPIFKIYPESYEKDLYSDEARGFCMCSLVDTSPNFSIVSERYGYGINHGDFR